MSPLPANGEEGVRFGRFCSGRPGARRKRVIASEAVPDSRDPKGNLELDRELIEIARMVRGFAIDFGEDELANHLDQLEKRAQEMLVFDKMRGAGFFDGGGYAAPGYDGGGCAAPGYGVEPLS